MSRKLTDRRTLTVQFEAGTVSVNYDVDRSAMAASDWKLIANMIHLLYGLAGLTLPPQQDAAASS